jgi:hypothetical protein
MLVLFYTIVAILIFYNPLKPTPNELFTSLRTYLFLYGYSSIHLILHASLIGFQLTALYLLNIFTLILSSYFRIYSETSIPFRYALVKID